MPMSLMLSRWMAAVRTDRVVLSFHVALTAGVFAFLAMLVLF
jgi:hypothetical protein